MSATASASPNYEQAGELKIGQVGIANLRVRTLVVDKLAAELRERVARMLASEIAGTVTLTKRLEHGERPCDAASAPTTG